MDPPLRVRTTQRGGASPTVPTIDTSKDPAADFYSYVNNNWQKHIHLPPFAGGYGVSEEIEEDVRDSLLAVVQTMRHEKPGDPLSMLATSFLHTASQKNSIIDLQRVLNTYECISDAKDIAHSIGAMNKIQARAPLSLVVSSDSYKSSKCCIYLYEPQLGLPDKHYYHSGVRNRILLKYSKLLATVGKLMNIEALESAIAIEAALIPYLSSDEDLTNMSISYNAFSLHELRTRFRHIRWEAMMEGWGVSEAVYDDATYIATNLNYLHVLNRLFHTMTLESWRTWMRAMTVLSFIEYLPPPFDDMHFDLYHKALRGIAEKIPQKYLTLKVMQTFAKQDLGRIFVRNAVADGTKAYATRLVRRLKNATVERLRGITWMEHSTRATAIKKVETMKFQVAFPDSWRSETEEVDIDPTRPLLNLLNLSARDTELMIEDLRYDRCEKTPKKWNDGVFEVNAYYYPEGNMMVVPAGILRAPFFDLERSDAWNLGGIGVAVGHEITHGFDADGRLYDEHGDYNDWWTHSDTATFKKMTSVLIDFFDGAPYMGGKVNGKLTLSENIADLGGLAIALQALESELPKDPRKRKEAYIEFFTSYAVSWRNKDRPKKAKQSLLLDSHAPAPLRVNYIVRQFQQFYDAFDILPTHTDYIPPERRIVLW